MERKLRLWNMLLKVQKIHYAVKTKRFSSFKLLQWLRVTPLSQRKQTKGYKNPFPLGWQAWKALMRVKAALWIWDCLHNCTYFSSIWGKERDQKKPANGNSRHAKLQLKQHVKMHDTFKPNKNIRVLKHLGETKGFTLWLKPKNITVFYIHFFLEVSVSIYMFKKNLPIYFLKQKVLDAQSCPTLKPMGCRQPGSSVHGIL